MKRGIVRKLAVRGLISFAQDNTKFGNVNFLKAYHIIIMIMNLYSAKTIEGYSKALYIKLKLMNK